MSYWLLHKSGCVPKTRGWDTLSQVSGFSRSHDQHGNRQIVAHRVDGIAENQVFEPSVAVRPHDDQIGLDFTGIAYDFLLGRERVGNRRFHCNSLCAKGLSDTFQVLFTGFDLGRGSFRAEVEAGEEY